MGVRGLKASVSDAGPLIHLKEIGCLNFLRLFESVYITESVESEIIKHGVKAGEIALLKNISRHNTDKTDVNRFVRENHLESLHSGETESLYLCKQINVPSILTDDLAVRTAAKGLKITPVGSLGVIFMVFRSGEISRADAERFITDLYDISSLYVTRTIVELAIEQMDKCS